MSDIYDGTTDFCEDRAFERKPRKVAAFEGDPRLTRTIVPAYSDIDQNGHVNNAKYAGFVVDALDPGAEGEIRTFQIDYRHEVLPGVPLEMQLLVQDGRVLAKGINPDGEIAFACDMELA